MSLLKYLVNACNDFYFLMENILFDDNATNDKTIVENDT